jgi:PPOX class probable F420-dependent enzyme
MVQASSPSAGPEALERVRQFLATGLQHATIATVNADGSPHQALIWCRLDGDTLVINSAVGRIWPANLRRDPRISVTLADGPRWIAIRGSVEVVDERAAAQADIAAMARHYHADEPERAEELIRARFELQRRVSFRLSLTSSKLHFED